VWEFVGNIYAIHEVNHQKQDQVTKLEWENWGMFIINDPFKDFTSMLFYKEIVYIMLFFKSHSAIGFNQ